MAERERLTNKERRERARAERKQREAEAARRRQRGNWRAGLISLVVVGVVAAVLIQAFTGGPTQIGDTIRVSAGAAEDAREAASCELLAERSPLPEAYHVDTASQLDTDAAYTDTRPTHSGPHAAGLHPVTPSASSQIDEVSSTHNLEHGAAIVWWDPEQVDSSTASAIGDWSESLNASGLRSDAGGVGVLTSPYEDPGISSGAAIAFRAWGTALDCQEWDETVANAFLLEHFGPNGIAPEAFYAPSIDDVLAWDDDAPDDGDAADEDAGSNVEADDNEAEAEEG